MIHPTALVDSSVDVSDDCIIGAFCVIERGVRLGQRVRNGEHAVIKSGTVLGDDVEVHAGVVLGDDPQICWEKFDFESGVVIGNRTVLREGVTVHRASQPGQQTRVGEDCLLMAYSHVAHDAVVGNHCILANLALVAGCVVVEDYVFPLLKSGAKYENTYLNGTISRPLIAKKLVEVARKYKADAICHGATGKGNDQVRFEASIMALAPDLKVVAPWREWNFKSREELMDYAKAHGIPVEATKKSPYSIDRNILYVSHEGGVLEDCKNEFPKEVLKMTQHPEDASEEAENVKIIFEKGVPIAVNDKKMDCVEVMQTLNKLGHKHGIGLIDIVEDRMVGMKSRGTYE